MSEYLYFHNRLMGRAYAEQDGRKIEALRGKVTDVALQQAVSSQIAHHEGKLQEAIETRERSGIEYYNTYLAVFKSAVK